MKTFRRLFVTLIMFGSLVGMAQDKKPEAPKPQPLTEVETLKLKNNELQIE